MRVSTPGDGYGDPLARDPALVLREVSRGYYQPDEARARFGVVIAGGGLDRAATMAERAARRASAAAE